MPLFDATDLLARYDARSIGQRVNDDGTAATAGEIPSNPRVLACMADAEGRLVMAATVGKRYTYAELSTAASAGNPSGNAIKRLLCDLTWGLILKARGLPAKEFESLAPAYAEAEQILQLIRTGERVFPDIPGVAEAGLPETLSNVPQPGDSPLLWSQNTRLFGVLDWPPQ